jgi:hypothetical protein
MPSTLLFFILFLRQDLCNFELVIRLPLLLEYLALQKCITMPGYI